MTKISVTVITFNEEKDIDKCLRSIQWVDEIIVVDSFSSDKTVEIAKKYTDKVIQRKWSGFSDQKNFAAEIALGEWILQFDADERATDMLKEEILGVINDSESLDGYYIARKNYWLGKWIKHGGWYPDYAIRLHKKGAGYWEGYSHERFVMNAKAVKTGTLKNALIHDNLKSIHEHVQKQIFSSLYEMREIVENNFKIYWIFPFRITGIFLWRFMKGPKNWLSVRLLYKELIKNKVEVVWLIPFYPLIRFFYMYFLRLGFLDGVAGFWIATLSSTNEALRYAKIWEYLHNKEMKIPNLDYTDPEKMQELYRSSWMG